MPDRPRTLSRPRPSRPPAEARRGSAHARGYTRSWQRLRLRVLADVGRDEFRRGGPLCACGAAATEVDHVRPHRGDPDLFWDADNLQSLCKPCHSRKTVAEDGGLGHPITPRATRGEPRPAAQAGGSAH